MSRLELAYIGKKMRAARASELYAKAPAILAPEVIRQEQKTRSRRHDSDDRRELAALNKECWQ